MKTVINKFNHLLNHVRSITGSAASSGGGEPGVQVWMTDTGLGFDTFNGVYPINGPLPHDAVEGYQVLRRSDLLRALDALAAVGNTYQPDPVPTTITLADVQSVDDGGLVHTQQTVTQDVSSITAYFDSGMLGWTVADDGPGVSTRTDSYSGKIRSRYVLEIFLYNTAPGLRNTLTYHDIDVSFTESDLDLNQEYTTPGTSTILLGADTYTKVETFLIDEDVDIQLRDVETGHLTWGPGLGGYNYVQAAKVAAGAEVTLAVTQGVLVNGAVTGVSPTTFTGPTVETHEDIEFLTALTFSAGTAGTILGGSTDSFGGGDGVGDVGAFTIQQNHAGSTFEHNDIAPPDPSGDIPIVTVQWDGAFVWALDTAAFSSLGATYPTFRRLSNSYSGL